MMSEFNSEWKRVTGTPPGELRIDVWSDIACPWCYVGKRRLEAALERFAHRDAVSVVWRAFELDPAAPRERDRTASYAARLAEKYRFSVPDAEAKLRSMTETAAKDGLTFRFDRVRAGNTFDAHRVVHLAAERGVQNAVKERMLRAYMTEGEPIGDPETLVRLGAEAGLDAAEVRMVMVSNAHADAVRADETQARELGINGVPFFVLNGRYAVSGAQPADVLLRALNEAWADLQANPVTVAEGVLCDSDGCTIP